MVLVLSRKCLLYGLKSSFMTLVKVASPQELPTMISGWLYVAFCMYLPSLFIVLRCVCRSECLQRLEQLSGHHKPWQIGRQKIVQLDWLNTVSLLWKDQPNR